MSIPRLRHMALLLGLAGMAMLAWAAARDVHGAAASYLYAWFFALGLPLGAMAMLFTHRLTGGRWGEAIAPVLLPGVATLPLLALMLLPLALVPASVYPWTDGNVQAWYLNVPFFQLRLALYVVLWAALAFALQRHRDPPRAKRIAAAGALIYGITITFAAVDLVMSLVPDWWSTSLGLLVGVSQMLSALALAILALRWLPGTQCDADVHHDLGNLLLALVMTWAYLAFTQFLISWYEDLPHEAVWYAPRLEHGWMALSVALLLFHFAVPFFVLLLRRAKRALPALASVAALLMLARVADSYWLVIPSVRVAPHWSDAAALLGVAGLWSWSYLGHWTRRHE